MAQATALRLLTVLTLVWAGACIGGNLVAAPAKFTVEALDLSLALQVGRAQFTWIGYVEWAGLAGIAVVSAVARLRPTLLLMLAVVLFLIQQLAVQPMLEARSDLIIAGEPYDTTSQRHQVFIALEAVKVLCLIAVGWGTMQPRA
ncbi:hypothetical protein [Tateyamaria omphalii]|uniref:DUF4149 domain-containing protein n=1 Tax=Tateyamaria omphalii TaxID=299262 RepID=A0A1P8MWY8_9RHOB|nr:hypothetical protein [Tateyamaria omphalii]APX12439.1 hypothetical protein BWR18_12695 [Tateyamaria omphalii]